MIHLNNYQLPAANSLLVAFKTLENVIITAQTEPTIWCHEGLYVDLGLCSNVHALLISNRKFTWTLFAEIRHTTTTSWEHYTGSNWYPVPHPDTLACERDQDHTDNAYRAYSRLPLYTGAYGELRLSLLRYWIAELQDAINKHAI